MRFFCVSPTISFGGSSLLISTGLCDRNNLVHARRPIRLLLAQFLASCQLFQRNTYHNGEASRRPWYAELERICNVWPKCGCDRYIGTSLIVARLSTTPCCFFSIPSFRKPLAIWIFELRGFYTVNRKVATWVFIRRTDAPGLWLAHQRHRARFIATYETCDKKFLPTTLFTILAKSWNGQRSYTHTHTHACPYDAKQPDR